MSTKLEQLTNQIYTEGVEKANKEAEAIIAQAEQKAAEILKKAQADAQAQALATTEKANSEAQNIMSELKTSSNQSINLIKQELTDLVQFKVVDENVKAAMDDKKFVQSIIEKTIQAWADKGNIDPTVLISDKDKDLENFLKTGINKALATKLEVKTDTGIASGFQIAAQDGSFKLSFTDQDFANLLKSLLRKSTIEFLF